MISKTRQAKSSHQRGKFGEDIALKYFTRREYRPIVKNYRIQGGELDLVLEKNGIIVFVEVKLRTGPDFGEGGEALTRTKKQKLLRAAFTFLHDKMRFGSAPRPWRLDLLDIRFDRRSRKAFIKHIPNIFEA